MTTMTSNPSQTSQRAFLWHFAEMVAVMIIGMGVFSRITALFLAGVGSGLTDQPAWLRIMLRGVNMTVPMVLWMAWRGHGAARNLEMAASMLVPSALAAALVTTGSLGVMTGMLIQHVVMVPAMLGVMLWRYPVYAHHSGAGHH